ncbi:MAG: RraA family protein [Rhizobiales bacterium]|nr:RraA family protein [Hyphomicrobiales bacterium]NRB13906.1 RraA family protein [Hyphomicrobiales bacterium]
MNQSLLDLLKKVDTPTVCNAIEVAQGKRGFNDFTRGTMLSSDPKNSVMVGYARTAQISALAPPTEAVEVIKTRRMAYYKHMSEGMRPAIVVVEDVDYPNCIGAYWGEVNTNIHKAFGLSGALTNGVMRDLGDLPDGFPVLAASIGPSHGYVHVKTIGQGANIRGMHVSEGALVHADLHGAVVIPDDIIEHLYEAIQTLLRNEKIVLNPAKQGNMSFEEFEKSWAEFENART